MKKIIFTLIITIVATYSFGISNPLLNTNNQKPSQTIYLFDIYKKLDHSILKSNDEEAIKAYLSSKNIEIANYLKVNYPNLGSLDGIETNDKDFVIFGLVYALAEHGGFLSSNSEAKLHPAIPGWLECVGGILGVSAIYELLSGAATATYASTMVIIKKLAKRYLGWIGVALAVYEISTECF